MEHAPGAVDPSMEDILASIRRILNEEEVKPAEPYAVAAPAVAAAPVEAAPVEPIAAEAADVLELDMSMMVSDPVPAAPAVAVHVGAPEPAPVHIPAPIPVSVASVSPPPPAAESVSADFVLPQTMAHISMSQSYPNTADVVPLIAPEAAAAAATSVGALIQTLAHERSTAVTRGGPTIEDLVREEVRPMLKDWLDTHLPPVVERMVRAEIERVINRNG
jgi:cell pole-organizing protein PopZ